MDEEQIKRRAEQLARMSNAELLHDQEIKRQEHRQVVDALARKVHGATFDDKFKSIDEVGRGLYAEEASTRNLALWALAWAWRDSARQKYFSRVEEIALADTDDVVRGAALGVLGSCYFGERDRRVGRILAAVILDDSEAEACRKAAYSGLVSLIGGICDQRPFPEGVDWNLVQQFMTAEDA
jgi:hypothetical protein